MKATTKTFEGTIEEYRQYLMMTGQGVAPKAEIDEKAKIDDEENASALSLEQFVRDVLHRLPIRQSQRDLFRVMWEAGDDGIYRKDLTRKLGCGNPSLHGILGSLGRRINQTPGSQEIGKQLGINQPGISVFFSDTITKNDDVFYRLRPEVRSVLEAEGLAS